MTYNISLIIWLLFGLLGTLYLYHIGIKRDWQDFRIKKGLVKHNVKSPPGYNQKCIFCIEIYKKSCIVFMLLSAFISACITVIFYIAAPNKNFLTVESMVITMLGLWFIFSIFTGSPISKDELSKEQQGKFYIKVLNLTSILKGFIIEKYVDYEYEFIMLTIKSKITSWYEKRNSSTNHLGTLIIRIHSNFFNKILPDDCNDGIKELLSETSLNILNLYAKDDTILYDELIRLFEFDMIKYGAKIIDLAEFINNIELLSISATSNQINQYLKDNLSKAASRGLKKKTLSDIGEQLKKVLADKKDSNNKNIGA